MKIRKISLPAKMEIQNFSEEFPEEFPETPETPETPESSEIIQKDSEEIEEVAEPTTKESEDSHGGDEATKDIEDSENPADEGEQDQESDQSECESSEESESEGSEGESSESSESSEENDDSEGEGESSESSESSESESSEGESEGEGESESESSENENEDENEDEDEDEDEDDDGGSKNKNTTFDVLERKYRRQRLSQALFKVLSRISEELTSEKLEGFDKWDISELMNRSVTKRSLNSCKYMKERKSIVVMIDTSGSCANWAELFSSIAQMCVDFGIADIYLCPNAQFSAVWDKKSKQFEYVGREFLNPKNRTIMFFGDFDGASILCDLSKSNKLYWFSNETRYEQFYDHSWNYNVSFNDFKGEYIPAITEQELYNTLHKFVFKYKFSSTKENERRHIINFTEN